MCGDTGLWVQVFMVDKDSHLTSGTDYELPYTTPSKEEQVLLTTEPTSQPLNGNFLMVLKDIFLLKDKWTVDLFHLLLI